MLFCLVYCFWCAVLIWLYCVMLRCVLLWQRVLRTWPLWLTFTLSVSQIVSLCPGYLLPPSLPALIVPALRSLSHSLTLRSLLTLPCFRWELVGRTLPPPGTNYQPPTGQHLASHLLFTCDHLFPLTTENLFWFSIAPLSTFCVHELVGLVWSGLVGLLVVVVPEQWWQRYWRQRQVVSWLWSRVSPTCGGGATRKYFEYSDTRRCSATEHSLSLCKNVPLPFSFGNGNGPN